MTIYTCLLTYGTLVILILAQSAPLYSFLHTLSVYSSSGKITRIQVLLNEFKKQIGPFHIVL